MRLALSLLLFISQAHADIPEKEILEIFEQRLNPLVSPEKFEEFAKNHSEQFPKLSKENPTSMIVEKETLTVGKETFTIDIGYRQVLIHSDRSDFLKKLWTTPALFEKVYDLDGPSAVPGNNTAKNFLGRVQKNIPAIEDQDYTLEYTVTEKSPYVFIRAKLHNDAKKFALRDNFKGMQVMPGSILVREISLLYPLRWYVRALGPIVRSTMKKELDKISKIEVCLIGSMKLFPPTDEELKICHEKSKIVEATAKQSLIDPSTGQPTN